MKKIILLCCFCMPLLSFAQTKDTTSVNESEQEILSFAEVMPEFPGGNDEMYRFLARNIVYPQKLREKDIEGKVIITFVVRKDGSLDDIKVINKTAKEFADEAIRIIKLMPKWTPGKEKGELVNVKFIVPIKFQVN
jgi:periplasmic protein TonB